MVIGNIILYNIMCTEIKKQITHYITAKINRFPRFTVGTVGLLGKCSAFNFTVVDESRGDYRI